MAAGARPVQLEPYDQGYRDGWHDIHISPLRRRKRRRQRSAEYALGYGHGRTDGATWGQYAEWADFTSAPRITAAPEPLVWTRRDGAFHAATWAVPSSGAAGGAGVVSEPISPSGPPWARRSPGEARLARPSRLRRAVSR